MTDVYNNKKRGWETKWTEEEDNILREFYPSFGWERVSELLPYRNKNAIHSRTSRLGIPYLTYDDTFFDKIDTEEKAYWLGFMCADGYVTTKNRWGIELAIVDIEHLKKFTKSFSYNGNVRTRVRNGHESCLIFLKNANMHKSLVANGVLMNKTETLKFPTEEQVPKNLLNHFIRGIVDGDGSYVFYTYEKPRKDRGNRVYPRVYKEINFVCKSEAFIKDLQSFLFSKGIKMNLSYNSSNKLPTLRVSNKENIAKLITYLYSNSTVYLDRKYIKSQTMLEYCLS